MDERVGSGMVLLFGLRTVVGVTEADQGVTAIIAGSIPNKADQGTMLTGDNSNVRHEQ